MRPKPGRHAAVGGRAKGRHWMVHKCASWRASSGLQSGSARDSAWERPDQQAWVALEFGLTVVAADPALDLASDMPTGIVPDHDDSFPVQGSSAQDQPTQELEGFVAVGTLPTGIEVEVARIVAFDPVVAQGFVRCTRQHHALAELHFAPGFQARLSEATEPALVFPQQQHVLRMLLSPRHPALTLLFFSRTGGRDW